MKKISFFLIAFVLIAFSKINVLGQSTVTWTNIVGVTVDANNDLFKSSGVGGWNAGASSTETLATGQDGWVQAILTFNNKAMMVGLSDEDLDASYTSIDYALYTHPHGNLEIYEQGGFRHNAGACAIGDTIRVERVGEQIIYKKNGTVIYTSQGYSTGKLIVDTSLDFTDAVLQNVTTSNFGDGTTQFTTLKVGTLTAPSGYSVAIAGKMICEGVKVQLDESWPDYVFDRSYLLKSLPEVEAYIKKHKHLPNIPSAKEVKENGLDLGEMNRLMLEKVEELTLHLIQQHKQAEQQEKELMELKKKIKNLK
ncbi:MAG: hypothetical protein ACPGJS_02015 [Flammeovirgaceae bacterium]